MYFHAELRTISNFENVGILVGAVATIGVLFMLTVLTVLSVCLARWKSKRKASTHHPHLDLHTHRIWSSHKRRPITQSEIFH